ncbi:DUF3325 domain-containing protein [Paraburkholderia tropica]|uniref:DUF3325 domain-containing protein n=1 Tax=Paraburkholderia tropica TaxID=92647 RepID=UPI0007EC93DC|nr:DUF3325 domain-containing protein [Paraburkholderia tropica]OBR54702.1 hypothetical protein A6456_37420 [Paraburkholderia tropica]
MTFTMISAYLFAFSAFVAIALSMSRHQSVILGRESTSLQHWASAVGWPLLAISFLPCFATEAFSIAVTQWIGTLTCAAFTVVLLRTWWPTLLRYVPWISTLAALATSLSSR